MPDVIYSMVRVGKVVPPNRRVLEDISLSYFAGAKIGVIGLNGAGKSTLLRIMAGIDTDFQGQTVLAPGIRSAICHKSRNSTTHRRSVRWSSRASRRWWP